MMGLLNVFISKLNIGTLSSPEIIDITQIIAIRFRAPPIAEFQGNFIWRIWPNALATWFSRMPFSPCLRLRL